MFHVIMSEQGNMSEHGSMLPLKGLIVYPINIIEPRYSTVAGIKLHTSTHYKLRAIATAASHAANIGGC